MFRIICRQRFSLVSNRSCFLHPPRIANIDCKDKAVFSRVYNPDIGLPEIDGYEIARRSVVFPQRQVRLLSLYRVTGLSKIGAGRRRPDSMTT